MEHHEFGCINCGKPRNKKYIINKDYDVYYKDSVSNSLMRVGFCKDCFDNGLIYDYKKIKDNLVKSEKKCADKNPFLLKNYKTIESATFVACLSYKSYHEKLNEKLSKNMNIESHEYVNIVGGE